MSANTALSTKPPVGSIAVTGSKGGVGKSNLVVNLAISLGKNGRRVLVVDGDLGLASIDVLLGLLPQRTAQQVICGEAELEEVLIEGPAGINILPAASGVPQLVKLDRASRERLMTALVRGTSLVDDVLVDTGAGLGETSLSLQLAASRVIVVTTPEPTSLVDAYASIKVLWNADPHKPVDLVVNDVDSDEEALNAYQQIARACKHFLQQEPGWLGPVYSDPRLPRAVKRQRALLDLYPTSRAARCYERIALQLSISPACGAEPTYWQQLAERFEEETMH
jgi:flagellar biosynthesis protein FlhG